MSAANFDSFVVFVPATCEGIQSGYDCVRVLALDERDAIRKACTEWYGERHVEAGTYIVARLDHVGAFEVEEARTPDIRCEVSVPDKIAELKAGT